MKLLRGLACLLALCLAVPAGWAREDRPYSLSLEVAYGEKPARARYLDDLKRALASWLASTGPFGAPVDRGEADLHLRVLLDRIEVDKRYPTVSGEGNVLFDAARAPTETYATLFETRVALLDPRYGDQTIVEKQITVFNEQGYTEFVTDPRSRSWDVNVDFLIDRVDAFLHKKRKKILRHLDAHPREAAR